MTKRSQIKNISTPLCCFQQMLVEHDGILEFFEKYDTEIPNGFCHSKWKSFIPYLLTKPNNERDFLHFQDRLPRELLKKYKQALIDYLLHRVATTTVSFLSIKTDIWEAALYQDKKPNFRKLCEFFFSREEIDWRGGHCGRIHEHEMPF